MSSVKKGQLTSSKEWARHLRPYWRRVFWKGERVAGGKEAETQLLEAGGNYPPPNPFPPDKKEPRP